MKISIINYEYPPIGGGAATFTKYLAQNLAQRDHKVSILTSLFNCKDSYTKINNNIEIFRVKSYRKSVYESSIKGLISFIFFGLLSIDKYYKIVKPDICINFFALPCGPLSLYMKKKYFVPYILCLRGADVPGFSPKETNFYHKIVKGFNKTIFKESLAITANSKGLRDLAYKFYNKKNIKVIYNGVDTELFKPIYSYETNSNVFNILFVGRLAHQKNIINFINSVFNKLNTNGLYINLNIVGDGPLKKKIMEIFQSSNYKTINFYGLLERNKLPSIYNSNDLLVLPSLYEGMSNVVLEAKACNLPVVAFNIAGNEEMLEEDKDFLIEKNNYNQMRNKIEKLINLKNFKSLTISKNFYTKFSMKNITDQYIDVINY